MYATTSNHQPFELIIEHLIETVKRRFDLRKQKRLLLLALCWMGVDDMSQISCYLLIRGNGQIRRDLLERGHKFLEDRDHFDCSFWVFPDDVCSFSQSVK